MMQHTIVIDEAAPTILQLIEALSPGDEALLVRNGRTVAKLAMLPVEHRKARTAGNCKSLIKRSPKTTSISEALRK